jgi:hypothetical protein
LRPFVTLALASLAMHFGYLHPSAPFASLGSDGATAVLALLAVLEVLSDNIRWSTTRSTFSTSRRSRRPRPSSSGASFRTPGRRLTGPLWRWLRSTR